MCAHAPNDPSCHWEQTNFNHPDLHHVLTNSMVTCNKTIPLRVAPAPTAPMIIIHLLKLGSHRSLNNLSTKPPPKIRNYVETRPSQHHLPNVQNHMQQENECPTKHNSSIQQYTLTLKILKQRNTQGSLGGLLSGALLSGGRQSPATISDSRKTNTGLGASKLKAYNLWAYNLGAYNLGVTISGYPFWNLGAKHWTGCLQSGSLQSAGLQSGSLQSGGLHSWATDFGSQDPLTGLETTGGLQSGAYGLGAYNLGLSIVGLGNTFSSLINTVEDPST